MGPKPINWSELKELPPYQHILFTGDNPPFSAELLPKEATAQPLVQICCRLCPKGKWIRNKDPVTYKQTSSYWAHLRSNHRPIYNKLKPNDNEESSS